MSTVSDIPGHDTPPILLKVRSNSDVKRIAVAIQANIDKVDYPVIRAIGHGAVGQASKAIAIASGRVAQNGKNLAVTVGFESVPSDREEGAMISAISYRCFLR